MKLTPFLKKKFGTYRRLRQWCRQDVQELRAVFLRLDYGYDAMPRDAQATMDELYFKIQTLQTQLSAYRWGH